MKARERGRFIREPRLCIDSFRLRARVRKRERERKREKE